MHFSNAREFIFIETLVKKREEIKAYGDISFNLDARERSYKSNNIPLKARQVRVIAFANKPRKRDKACLAHIRVINVI